MCSASRSATLSLRRSRCQEYRRAVETALIAPAETRRRRCPDRDANAMVEHRPVPVPTIALVVVAPAVLDCQPLAPPPVETERRQRLGINRRNQTSGQRGGRD